MASQRAQGDGSGNVREIRLGKRTLTIVAWDQTEYEYRYQNGYRWRSSQGWIGRQRLEDELGTWPGYADALEDLAQSLWEKAETLEEAKTEHERELHSRWDRTYDSLRTQMCLDRHPTLRIWRERNPQTVADIPACLKGVRWIKRLDVSLPCHVYFLVRSGAVVYVGQTSAPWPARILQHIEEGEKAFDDIWYLEVDRGSLPRVEQSFIKQFDPEYNRSGTPRARQRRSAGDRLSTATLPSIQDPILNSRDDG